MGVKAKSSVMIQTKGFSSFWSSFHEKNCPITTWKIGICLFGAVEVGRHHCLAGHQGALSLHNWSTRDQYEPKDFQGHRVNLKARATMCSTLQLGETLTQSLIGTEVTSGQYCSLNQGIKKIIQFSIKILSSFIDEP